MANRKFTITPIGSCRIATPARAGVETHGIAVIRPRSYGFTHSSAEAVQQAAFMLEGGAIPRALWPLIGRDNDYDKIHAAAFRPADLYLVEISSAKMLRLDDYLIQLNYTQNHFRDFFSVPARASRFWAMIESDDVPGLEAFLEEQWSGSEEQRRDSDLLRRIRISRSTDATLRADLRSLRQMLGDDIVIVTHVNARDQNGRFLPSRDQLIQQVGRVSQEEGFEVFDPTLLVEKVGQDLAVDNGSGSYAHYHEMFFPLLFQEWYEAFIRPRIDRNAIERDAVDALAANLNARLAAGARAEVDQRLAALPENLRSRPQILPLGGKTD